jgi:hypothetical protein
MPVPEEMNLTKWLVGGSPGTVKRISELNVSRSALRQCCMVAPLSHQYELTTGTISNYIERVASPSLEMFQKHLTKWRDCIDVLRADHTARVDNRIRFGWTSALQLSSFGLYRVAYKHTCVHYETFMLNMCIAALHWVVARVARRHLLSSKAPDARRIAVERLNASSKALIETNLNALPPLYFLPHMKQISVRLEYAAPDSTTGHEAIEPFHEKNVLPPEISGAVLVSLANVALAEAYEVLSESAENPRTRAQYLLKGILSMEERFVVSRHIFYWFAPVLRSRMFRFFSALQALHQMESNEPLALFAVHCALQYAANAEQADVCKKQILSLFSACEQNRGTILMKEHYVRPGTLAPLDISFADALLHFAEFAAVVRETHAKHDALALESQGAGFVARDVMPK